jgi:hypothetical protein
LSDFGLGHYRPLVTPVETATTPPSTQAPKWYWQWLSGLIMTWVIYVVPFALPWWKLAWHEYHYGPELALAPGVLLIALLAPLVSYRRIDGLCVLVPIWGFVVAWKIGARLSKLPYRDWPLRSDELAQSGGETSNQ